MKNKIAAVLLSSIAMFTATMASAASLTQAEQQTLEQLKQQSLNSDLSYQIIESLTTEVGNRLMGSEGDKKSIVWAVNKMKALGFDKVWTEEVTSTQWLRGEAQAKILAPYPQDMVALALGGSVGTGEQGMTAEIAHFHTLADLKAAKAESLKGKIAFVSYRMKRHIDGHGYGKAVGTRVNGASIAAEKGAVALLMRSVGTDNNRTAHTGVMRYKDGVKKIPAAAISNPDADLLVNMLKREKPVSVFLKLTAQVNQDVVIKSANVIGEITGSEKPEEIVAIGAHLDSWDVGTGALDDGLGIGMVMSAAHQIGQLPTPPKRTVRVILFAAEEVGLLGAKKYVELHQNTMDKHVIGAEWDFGLGRIYKMKTGVGAASLNAMREFAQYVAPLGVALAPENNARAQSDMGALSDKGMPSVSFSPDGSRYFDYHHTENDTLDKVNPNDLKQNTAVYTMFAYFAAMADVDFRK